MSPQPFHLLISPECIPPKAAGSLTARRIRGTVQKLEVHVETLREVVRRLCMTMDKAITIPHQIFSRYD